MQQMLENQVDEYYYLTLMNENYPHPDMPEGAAEGILKGMYLFREAAVSKKDKAPRVQLLGSGTILREVIAAAELKMPRALLDLALPRTPRARGLASPPRPRYLLCEMNLRNWCKHQFQTP